MAGWQMHLRALLLDSLRAHALIFERPLAPSHDASAGARILVAFVLVAFVLLFALRELVNSWGLRGLAPARLGMVALLLGAFLLAQHLYVRLPWDQVGLRPARQWTPGERLYASQLLPLVVVLFALLFGEHLGALWELHSAAGFLVYSVATGLAWGMVQEFLYRGWLQTELTRRFGAVTGLLAANTLFTFGPLHLDYVFAPGGTNWIGLGAIFAIGLLFGVIYLRSGNLWIVALLHGLWPPNMS